MSKFKINDKVRIKSNGKIGVIKGRDMQEFPDGKVAIEYIVKTDEGFANWKSYLKSDLEKVLPTDEKKDIPTLVVSAPNGRTVLLAAVIRNEKIWKDKFDSDGVYAPYIRKGKDLRIGYAICNPNDEYDYDYGVRLAVSRAKKCAFCHLISDFSGEFNKETVNALLKVKADYIVNNIEHFTTK